MKKSNSVAEKCKAFLQPIISDLGYQLVDVDYDKKSTGYNLTVYIDRGENYQPIEAETVSDDAEISEESAGEGISLADCEKVHRTIDEKLDELDPTSGESYILNVSSCGLDWAFRTDRDYQKNIGKMVDVSLYAPIDKKKNYTGTLDAFDDSTITITAKKQMKINREQIAKICQHIEF